MPQCVGIKADPDGQLTVIGMTYLGSHREIRLANDRCELLAVLPAHEIAPILQSRVVVKVAPDNVHTFAARTRASANFGGG
jgi:hypothetical protein